MSVSVSKELGSELNVEEAEIVEASPAVAVAAAEDGDLDPELSTCCARAARPRAVFECPRIPIREIGDPLERCVVVREDRLDRP